MVLAVAIEPIVERFDPYCESTYASYSPAAHFPAQAPLEDIAVLQ